MRMDLLPYNDENLLCNFPPTLRKNFKELCCSGQIGLSSISLNDITPIKQYIKDSSTYSYHYTLRMPYAGNRLNWEMFFDPDDISFAPDFNFNDDTFYMSSDLDLIMENVPSLMHWNVNNPQSLSLLLKEFLSLYKKQQLHKLQQDNIYAQLNSEYQVLTEEINPSDIEICLENTCAHFLINIKVDVSKLPEYLQPMKDGVEFLNPGEETCLLKISYMKLDGSRINTSLQLSAHLDQLLGNTNKLHIPNYTKTTSLADYVNLITKVIQDHIKRIEQHHNHKEAYISCLFSMYGHSVIEIDSETFSKCVLLCEVDGFHCLVHIEIGEHFPEEKPTVTLQSLYCSHSPKKLCMEKIDYPYSSKWVPELAARKLASSLLESVPKFRNHKH